MFEKTVAFIKSLYPGEVPVPLHAPRFGGNEKKYLLDCIDTTYVSYVGEYVGRFEAKIREYTGAAHAVAVSSGTAALHTALMLAGVSPGDEVITQPLTFVATANAIAYCGARPVFVDVEQTTLGLDPDKLADFLAAHARPDPHGGCRDRTTGGRIAACVPVHTFGHPARIDRILEICGHYGLPVVEDAAEALGSFYRGRHAGTFGEVGILSFNGNKPVTTGGGGMIITGSDTLAARAKHLTTTAKRQHTWEFFHDEVGYNYRLPNINAAVGCAQMERFAGVRENKRVTAELYRRFFAASGMEFIVEPPHAQSNYWLNALVLKDREERDAFLAFSRGKGIQTRPVWSLVSDLPMYRHCRRDGLETARRLEGRLANIPSSVRI